MTLQTMGIPARGLSLIAHFGANAHSSALGTHYFALFDDHPFSGGVEPDIGTGNYGRATVTNGVAMYGTPTTSTVQISNLQDIVWPTASGLWSITGDLTWCGVYDAATAGTLWYAFILSVPKVVSGASDQPRELAGGLIIRQGA